MLNHGINKDANPILHNIVDDLVNNVRVYTDEPSSRSCINGTIGTSFVDETSKSSKLVIKETRQWLKKVNSLYPGYSTLIANFEKKKCKTRKKKDNVIIEFRSYLHTHIIRVDNEGKQFNLFEYKLQPNSPIFPRTAIATKYLKVGADGDIYYRIDADEDTIVEEQKKLKKNKEKVVIDLTKSNKHKKKKRRKGKKKQKHCKDKVEPPPKKRQRTKK